MRRAHNRIDRIGQRFGRLTVVGNAGTKNKAAVWHCRCDCGRSATVSANGLRSGTSSCGCSRRTGKHSRPSYRSAYEPGSSAKRNLLKNYKDSARNRLLQWALTDSEFFAATQRQCVYCGIPPSRIRRVSRNGSFTWNGLDRIDSSGGYTSVNIATCCATCNHAKCNMSHSEFTAWIDRLVAHRHTAVIAARPEGWRVGTRATASPESN